MPKRKISESLGERLIRLRGERGLTQAELAAMAGLAQPYISDYERGVCVPNATTIIRLSGVLGISTDALLGLEPAKSVEVPLDRAVLRRIRKIGELSRRDRTAVLRTLDAFLDRGRTQRRRRAKSG